MRESSFLWCYWIVLSPLVTIDSSLHRVRTGFDNRIEIMLASFLNHSEANKAALISC